MSNKNFLPDGPINLPSARPWWHIPTGIAAGVIVLGGGTYGVLQSMHHDPHPVAVAKKTPAKKKTSATVATGPVTPPNYVSSTSPKTGHVFSAIAAINNRYIAWADRQISLAVPAIPSSGPYAGTLTAGILNSPLTLKKWPGPTVPSSLAAAGVKLPVGTPANGSIVYNTPSMSAFWAQMMVEAHPYWPQLTMPELQAAFKTAAEYTLAANGDNPVSSLKYVESYAMGGAEDQSFLKTDGGVPLYNVFTAPVNQAGMLVSRQMVYDAWATYTMQGSVNAGGNTQVTPSSTVTLPGQQVLVNGLNISGMGVTLIESYAQGGHLVIGPTHGTVGAIQLVLVKDSAGQSRWYVTASSSGGSNVPNHTYWTGP